MTTKPEPVGPSLQDCMNKLEEALTIIMKDSEVYYLRNPQEVSVEALGQVSRHLLSVNLLMLTFGQNWLNSRKSGPDAIATFDKLEERIDMKLTETGKLDFQQFKRIMKRLHRADDALLALDRIDLYLSHLREMCRQKELKGQFRAVNTFMIGVLHVSQNSIRSEIYRLSNQISRCSLYYDNVLKSKTFRIAFSSLLVSALSVLFSLINITLQDGMSFQILGYPQILALITSAVFFAVLCYLTVQWFER